MRILGIDIGSHKICAVIAQNNDDENLHIIGVGNCLSQGIKKGAITNIELASKSIKNALQDAQRMAGTNYDKVIISISGAYAKSIESTDVVNIPSHEIGISEIKRVLQGADHRANIPHDYEKLHVLPWNFKIDNQDNIEDPLGMNGDRLEVKVHIIIVQKSFITNLKKAAHLAGLEIDNIVYSGYASCIAILNKDEKELGAALIDMGGDTCNLVVHSGNSVVYNDFLAVGSENITFDLSSVLHTPPSKAQEIKLNYGNLIDESIINNSEKILDIPELGDQNKINNVSLDVISNIIKARVEETLILLDKILEESGHKEHINAGIILTGGMSKLSGMIELAERIFGKTPVRIADIKEKNISPCAYGLCLYGIGKWTQYEIDSQKVMRYKGELAKTNLKLLNNLEYKDNEEENTKDNLVNIAEIEQEKKENYFTKIWKKITNSF